MRVLIVAVVAAATAFVSLAVVPAAQAKRVQYSCVEVSPGHFVCTGSTSRP